MLVTRNNKQQVHILYAGDLNDTKLHQIQLEIIPKKRHHHDGMISKTKTTHSLSPLSPTERVARPLTGYFFPTSQTSKYSE